MFSEHEKDHLTVKRIICTSVVLRIHKYVHEHSVPCQRGSYSYRMSEGMEWNGYTKRLTQS